MADIEQKEDFSNITFENFFDQHVADLVFVVTDLNLGVQINPVKHFQNNSVGPWNMSQCGLRPLITFLISASLFSET